MVAQMIKVQWVGMVRVVDFLPIFKLKLSEDIGGHCAKGAGGEHTMSNKLHVDWMESKIMCVV